MWGTVVLSDEKKLTLEGPDGNNFSWPDLRRGEKVLWKRQNECNGAMVWRKFTENGIWGTCYTKP